MPTLAYLLLGQSNAFGMSPWPQPDPSDTHLLMLDPRCLGRDLALPERTIPAQAGYTAFRPAAEPLHSWLYPGQIGQGGMGPAKPFGQRIRARYPHARIALLVTAHPSAITSLAPGSESYAVTRDTALYARDALGATIAGVLTHHGEADTSDLARADAWDGLYIDLIERLRADLGIPDLPAVHAQLGLCALSNIDAWSALKAAQARVTPDRLPHSRMVKTDLFMNWRFDKLHSSTVSNLAEGYALGDAIAEIGHPLFAGAPYSSHALPTFDTDTDRQTVICTNSAVITKVCAGTLVNASLSVNGTPLASGAEYWTTAPYSTTIRVTGQRVGPGNWLAPFSIHDTLSRVTPYALEGCTP